MVAAHSSDAIRTLPTGNRSAGKAKIAFTNGTISMGQLKCTTNKDITWASSTQRLANKQGKLNLLGR